MKTMLLAGELCLDASPEIAVNEPVAAILAYIRQLATRLAREDHEAELKRDFQPNSEEC